MGRPETWTAAVLVVLGLGLALWLAAQRPPSTPDLPSEPDVFVASLGLAKPAVPRGSRLSIPDPGGTLGADGLNCGPSADVSANSAGWVQVTLIAPCRVDEALQMTYGPFSIEESVGPRGLFYVALPYLGPDQGLEVRLAGRDAISLMPVAEQTPLILGLSWNGSLKLGLEVLEFGQLVQEGRPARGRILRFGTATGPQSLAYVLDQWDGNGLVRPNVSLAADTELCGGIIQVSAFDTLARDLATRSVAIEIPECEGPLVPFAVDAVLDSVRINGPPG